MCHSNTDQRLIRLTEDLVHYAVESAFESASAKRVQYAEARLHVDSGSAVTLNNGVPEPVQLAREKGIAVRVLVDGAMAFASTNDLSKTSLDKTIETAYRTAKASKRLLSKPIRLSQEKAEQAEWKTETRKSLLDLSTEEKFAILEEIEKTVQPGVVNVALPSRILILGDNISERYFANTEGANIHLCKSLSGSSWFCLPCRCFIDVVDER
jgi:TldD protein